MIKKTLNGAKNSIAPNRNAKVATTATTNSESKKAVSRIPYGADSRRPKLSEIKKEQSKNNAVNLPTIKSSDVDVAKVNVANSDNKVKKVSIGSFWSNTGNYPDFENTDLIDDGCGRKCLPYPVEYYDTVPISTEYRTILMKNAVESIYLNKFGKKAKCYIIKTVNSIVMTKLSSSDGYYKLEWLMDRVDIVKKVRAADGNVYLDIKVTDELGAKIIRVKSSELTNLEKYGIQCNIIRDMTIKVYLNKLAKSLPMEDASQVIGVVKDRKSHNSFAFNGYTAEDAFKTNNTFDSYEEYINRFNVLIKHSAPIQFLLSATMAAPVLTVLQQKYNMDLHSYIINIVGASSTGKTISSRLCASAWTNPMDEKIFGAMLATGNASLKRLSGRYGIPTFFDEATVHGNTKPEEYIYSVYEGREKKRLNPDCSEKASGTWSTIICMSSEEHFHSNHKNQNGGLAVRVMNVDNLQWTVSKQHCEAINRFIGRNYGVLGKRFVEYLFRNEQIDNLEELYKQAKKKMNDACASMHHKFSDRLCETYALTLMTAQLLKEIGVSIDIDSVVNIMEMHNYTVGEEQNIAENALKAIANYVAEHAYSSGVKIIRETNCTIDIVAIKEDIMQELLANAGFKDCKVVIRELDKEGYLVRQEKAGLKSKLRFNKVPCACYQIDVSEKSVFYNYKKKALKEVREDEAEYTEYIPEDDDAEDAEYIPEDDDAEDAEYIPEDDYTEDDEYIPEDDDDTEDAEYIPEDDDAEDDEYIPEDDDAEGAEYIPEDDDAEDAEYIPEDDDAEDDEYIPEDDDDAEDAEYIPEDDDDEISWADVTIRNISK